jgi:hypothetical protein
LHQLRERVKVGSFLKQRKGIVMAEHNTSTIQPQGGMLLVFPAWLDHSVEEFEGEGERISVW